MALGAATSETLETSHFNMIIVTILITQKLEKPREPFGILSLEPRDLSPPLLELSSSSPPTPPKTPPLRPLFFRRRLD